MDFGLERGSKGLTGSLSGILDFPSLLRLGIPGTLALLLAVPLLQTRFDLLAVLVAPSRSTVEQVAMVAALYLAFGLPVAALNDFFYKLYEGRVMWPDPLFELGRKLQQRRVDRLMEKARKARAEGKDAKYDELWFELRVYPEKDGDPHATHPTLLGNVLAGYEAYPEARYGMDSVFFWPRIWLEMDRDKKREIDSAWAVADGLVNVSAVCFLGALSWAAAGVLAAFGAMPLFAAPPTVGWGVAALLLAGYFFYRVSLPWHRRNGEIFKSIFDLYRGKLEPLFEIGPRESERWRRVWLYLQYGGVECSACGKSYSAGAAACPDCQRDTAKNLEDLAELSAPEVAEPDPAAARPRPPRGLKIMAFKLARRWRRRR